MAYRLVGPNDRSTRLKSPCCDLVQPKDGKVLARLEILEDPDAGYLPIKLTNWCENTQVNELVLGIGSSCFLSSGSQIVSPDYPSAHE